MTTRKERPARRALLFMPGDSLRKIEKAATLNVDAVIMDLEDGVAMSRKDEARQIVFRALQEVDFGRTERMVRINPVGSGLESDDLNLTLPGKPEGYVLPKVENARQVQRISAEIAYIERREGWEKNTIRLLAIIETALGVANVREIAGSDARLDALIFGAEDLAGSIGATRTREGWEVFYARSAVVIHAVAFNLQPIDTVFVDLNDLEGLANEAAQAAQMGYTGKLAIHPQQIEPITQVFTPTDEAIAHAQRLIEAYQAHQSGGIGAFVLDGKMVDAPMVRAAQHVLARARAAGKI